MQFWQTYKDYYVNGMFDIYHPSLNMRISRVTRNLRLDSHPIPHVKGKKNTLLLVMSSFFIIYANDLSLASSFSLRAAAFASNAASFAFCSYFSVIFTTNTSNLSISFSSRPSSFIFSWCNSIELWYM